MTKISLVTMFVRNCFIFQLSI